MIISDQTQRIERWQYPISAIREIVINMIVHRDYTFSGDASIKVFNNKIEFFNPGSLPDSISIDHLLTGNYVSEARNKKIANIFKEAGIIEKYGSGIQRVIKTFSDYKLDQPLFENIQNGFRVTIFSQGQTVEKSNQQD